MWLLRGREFKYYLEIMSLVGLSIFFFICLGRELLQCKARDGFQPKAHAQRRKPYPLLIRQNEFYHLRTPSWSVGVRGKDKEKECLTYCEQSGTGNYKWDGKRGGFVRLSI